MNRQQRRILAFPKGKQEKHQKKLNINDNNSQEILDGLEPAQLVAGINKLVSQLREMGVELHDWDNKDKSLYKVQMIKGKFYYLSGSPDDWSE